MPADPIRPDLRTLAPQEKQIEAALQEIWRVCSVRPNLSDALMYARMREIIVAALKVAEPPRCACGVRRDELDHD